MTETKLLSNSWNLWSHLPHDTDWSIKSYQKIYNSNTVEEIVSITELVPDTLVKNCMLFLMKNNIEPIWEDPKNRNGGCLSYKIPTENIYEIWKEIVYLIVGNTISDDKNFISSITGISVCPKKKFCNIKIWLSDFSFLDPKKIICNSKEINPQQCMIIKNTPDK